MPAADGRGRASSAEGELRSLDIDLEGRIDPSGQRIGKRIPYKLSELRIQELLEGGGGWVSSVCEDVEKGYQLTPRKPKQWASTAWMEPEKRDAWKSDARLGSQHRQLRSYCDMLLDDHDESLTAALQVSPPPTPPTRRSQLQHG